MKSYLDKLPLGASILALLTAPELLAQSTGQLFPQFLTPSFRGSANSERSEWDVFYSPFGSQNLPDMAAPNGIGQLASEAAMTPPANSNPGDPYAFWNPANPSITQTGTSTAFVIGPGISGNIYSFAAATAYQVADSTPYTLGTVVFQFQTDGEFIDRQTLKLRIGGTDYLPANIITEYKTSGSAFGGVTNRTAAQWNLTGLNASSYSISFASPGASNSFQLATLETKNVFVQDAVPSARTWSGGAGADKSWSNGSNWSSGTTTVAGGNVMFSSGSSATLDSGREAGEVKFSAPGIFTLNTSAGSVLKVNTGFVVAAAATATVNAPVLLGGYHLNSVAAGATLNLNGVISGATGMLFSGPGSVNLNASNTFTGSLSVDGATVKLAGSNVYSGSTTVASGKLEIASNFTGSGAVTIEAGAELIVSGSLNGAGALALHAAKLSGGGAVNRPLLVDAGSVLSPGAGIGTLTFGSPLSLGGGGSLLLEMNDVDSALGWDRLNVSGSLSIAAASGNKFTLVLDSLTLAGAPGLVHDFNPNANYLWTFASASGGISGFAASAFAVDASSFDNPHPGAFRVAQNGNHLDLVYTAMANVPEPGSAVLFACGAGLLGLRFRRRSA